MSSLFVQDDDVEMTETPEASIPTPEDPVVDEIPLFLNQLPSSTESNLSLAVFQYVSHLSSRPITLANGVPVLATRYKLGAETLEMDVPLDTSRFYDSEKAEALNQIQHQTLAGKLEPMQGSYVLCFKYSGNQRSAVITPLDRTVQMRPVFHYIDLKDEQEEADKDEEVIADQTEKPPAKSTVQVVQMTAKSSGSENEIRYSEAIQSFKKYTQEEFVESTWKDESEEMCKALGEEMWGGQDHMPDLEPESKKDYYERLLGGLV